MIALGITLQLPYTMITLRYFHNSYFHQTQMFYHLVIAVFQIFYRSIYLSIKFNKTLLIFYSIKTMYIIINISKI